MLESSVLRWLERLYTPFVEVGSHLQSLFLLYMRLTWGHQFFLYGIQKLSHIDQTIQFMASYPFPHPELFAYLAGLIELIGGFCLIFGFASRLVAVPLIVHMLIDLSTVHAPNISNFRFLLEPLSLVREVPYPFLITALLVLIFGPGRISVDAWLKRWFLKQPRY